MRLEIKSKLYSESASADVGSPRTMMAATQRMRVSTNRRDPCRAGGWGAGVGGQGRLGGTGLRRRFATTRGARGGAGGGGGGGGARQTLSCYESVVQMRPERVNRSTAEKKQSKVFPAESIGDGFRGW